jgi:tRNA (pseudouridine54-N1)-methyltransferase
VTRRFVLIGREASASEEFLLDDVPGTSGRLDIGLRCVRAAMLLSHGLRRDVVVDLVLGGGPRAPRALRVRGAEVKFLRPDERSLAVLVKKVLASHADEERSGYVEVKPGIAVARGGLPAVLADLGGATPYLLEEHGFDVRAVADLASGDSVFFLGDPGGFDSASRASLEAIGARPVCVGPSSLHAEDVVVLVNNELDRRLSPSPHKGYPRAP